MPDNSVPSLEVHDRQHLVTRIKALVGAHREVIITARPIPLPSCPLGASTAYRRCIYGASPLGTAVPKGDAP
jgi:hypothetical protein